MTSVQERLQLKRVAALDKWSVREQLCLASAVACSGDQNWMSVSRSLKMLCGNNRPADWFSQKSCAVQYGELLENVETPKRKKRNTSSERDSGIVVAETPTESILRKLTQERISELRATIRRNQEEYMKLREEILFIQNGSPTEAQLKEMWAQIEQEKEQKLLEQQKYAQWLKEREERKMELQKAWRPGTSQQSQAGTSSSATSQQQQSKLPHLKLNIKSEDVDTDDSNSKSGTSPLLTSLLKSPSPAPSSSTGITTSTTISNVRVTAPTITNLLTGNNAHIQQIASTSTSTVTQFHSVHNQPLTVPVRMSLHPQLPSTTPSKSAPTLSMLLENKNKEGSTVSTATTGTVTIAATEIKNEPVESTSQEAMETEYGDNSPNKDEDQQLMEVFNGLIPDNIDELADILTNNNAIILNPELLEEESILENVESLIDDQEDEEKGKENVVSTSAEENVKKSEKNEQDKKITKDTTAIGTSTTVNTANEIKIKEEVKEEDNVNSNDLKIESKAINDSNKEIIEKKDVKIEETEAGSVKDNDNLDEKNIQDVKNANEQKHVEKDEVKNNEVEEKGTTKSQNSEISDDSSDNTSLQILKEKITTTAATENKKSTVIQVEEERSSPETHSTEDNKESTNTTEEEEDIIMEITTASVTNLKDDNEEMSIELENTVSLEEKSNKSLAQQNEKEPKNEIVIEENNDVSSGNSGDEEQKKSPSESSVIVIQEDDDSSAEKIEPVSKELNDKAENSQKKNSVEKSTDVVADDSQRSSQEDSSTEVQDEKQSTSSSERKRTPEISIEQIPATTAVESKSKGSGNGGTGKISNSTTIVIEPATTTIVIDTDEESPVEIIKDDVTPRTKRDYSRRKLDSTASSCSTVEKKFEEPSGSGGGGSEESGTVVNRQNLSIKRLKERERSESPLIDDETTDTIPRTRRRYSSTPIFDSIPNSPASSDDKEYKAWKKSILMIYNRLTIHKNASIFLRPVTEDVAPNYKQIVHRPMDLQTIKKNIENGVIRTTAEFQRDVMLMCQNAIMYNQTNNNVYNMAKEMWADSVNVIETLLESVKKDATDRSFNNTSSSKSRGRKSNRLP